MCQHALQLRRRLDALYFLVLVDRASLLALGGLWALNVERAHARRQLLGLDFLNVDRVAVVVERDLFPVDQLWLFVC